MVAGRPGRQDEGPLVRAMSLPSPTCNRLGARSCSLYNCRMEDYFFLRTYANTSRPSLDLGVPISPSQISDPPTNWLAQEREREACVTWSGRAGGGRAWAC